MVGATGQERGALCTACFSGEYPVSLPGEIARAQGIPGHDAPHPDPVPLTVKEPA